jgi:hypothetical protein
MRKFWKLGRSAKVYRHTTFFWVRHGQEFLWNGIRLIRVGNLMSREIGTDTYIMINYDQDVLVEEGPYGDNGLPDEDR